MTFHAMYTNLVRNTASLSAADKESAFHILRILGLREGMTVRRSRQPLLDGLQKLWAGKRPQAAGAAKAKKFDVAVPWKIAGMNGLVPTLLGVDATVYPSKGSDLSGATLHCAFGYGAGEGNVAVEKAAHHAGKPVFRMEYGFISSFGLALHDSVQHSLILCPEVMYYDARNASSMENDLNAVDFALTEEEKARAKRLIKLITERKITKYNHAPDVPLNQLLPLSGRKKILLVDQRFGDASIGYGLAGQDAFQKMWQEALKHEDHDIIVKLHPDAVTGGKESCLSKVLPKKLPGNVHVLTQDVNPYNVLSEVDKVFVCVSQLGFEALMLGKETHCFGVSFYTGWGLTVDHVSLLRPRRKRTLQDLFHVFYIEYSRYALGQGQRCELEELVEHLASGGKTAAHSVAALPLPSRKTEPLRVLMVIPSARWGATGRYFQVLAMEMQKLGAEVMVLAEAKEDRVYENVTWLKLDFEGIRLSAALREKIARFSPHIVYENGVRTRAQRAALEIMYLTKAKLALQSEDDDIQVYLTRHPSANPELIALLDKPMIARDDLLKFITMNDWGYTLKVLMEPEFDRWIDPVIRALCYHCSSLNTAIWHPFARRLEREYGAPTMVVPPVADPREISEEKLRAYRQGRLDGVKPGNLVMFLGGSIYDYSPEFEIFLKALNLLCRSEENYGLTLIVSGKGRGDVSQLGREILDARIQFINLETPNDDVYMKHLVLADVICSPGLPDRFNEYRLPSRLVKPMLMGKAVLTTRIGFGESLEHGENAILIDGETPEAWAQAMRLVFDQDALLKMGQNGKAFASKHFNPQKVAAELLENFSKIAVHARQV